MLMSDRFATRTHDKMKEVLMDSNAQGPTDHYFMIRGGAEVGNITVWETGLVGQEYIKTYGHYHVDDLPETYWILEGEGIALLQKRAGDGEDASALEDFKVVRLKAGDQLEIPVGYGHLVVNTGATFLVTKDDSPVYFGNDSASMPRHATYEPVREMHGFAYYVVEHEGAPALVKNMHYTLIEKEDLSDLPVVVI